MKVGRAWVIAVLLLYAIVIATVLWVAPWPWNLLVALFVTLLGVKFVLLIRKVAESGARKP